MRALLIRGLLALSFLGAPVPIAQARQGACQADAARLCARHLGNALELKFCMNSRKSEWSAQCWSERESRIDRKLARKGAPTRLRVERLCRFELRRPGRLAPRVDPRDVDACVARRMSPS